MNNRKILGIIGGIMTLVSTYFLAFYKSGDAYASGLGALRRIPLMFADAPSYSSAFGVPSFLIYIITILLIIFLISGVFQILIGTSRALSIVGSLFALFFAVFLLLLHSGIFPIGFTIYELMFIGDPIVPGVLPFHVEIATYSLGIYILLIGSILSLVGGILVKRD